MLPAQYFHRWPPPVCSGTLNHMGHPLPVDPQEPAAEPELRAKAIARRSHTSWDERDGVWETTIGRWNARVAPGVDGKLGWEWRAFSIATPGDAPLRALGGRSWVDREQAQQDAELTLARHP